MPTLADLGFALIKMYFEDHDPPHVHAVLADGTVRVEIETLRITRVGGRMPSPADRRAILEWIETRRPTLIAAFRAEQAWRHPDPIA